MIAYRDDETEQQFARCGGCKRLVRVAAPANRPGRVAWAEEIIQNRTVYYCYPCAVERGACPYDAAPPRVGRPRGGLHDPRR